MLEYDIVPNNYDQEIIVIIIKNNQDCSKYDSKEFPFNKVKILHNINIDFDILFRINTIKAKAIFAYCKKTLCDSSLQEKLIDILILKIKRYYPEVPIYTQRLYIDRVLHVDLNSSQKQTKILGNTIAVMKLKCMILRKAFINPGFLTFSQNLIFNENPLPNEINSIQLIMRSYLQGCENKIVVKPIPSYFVGKDFYEIVYNIYFRSIKNIFTKIRTQDDNDIRPILLIGVIESSVNTYDNNYFFFPHGKIIKYNVKGIFITYDKNNYLDDFLDYFNNLTIKEDTIKEEEDRVKNRLAALRRAGQVFYVDKKDNLNLFKTMSSDEDKLGRRVTSLAIKNKFDRAVKMSTQKIDKEGFLLKLKSKQSGLIKTGSTKNLTNLLKSNSAEIENNTENEMSLQKGSNSEINNTEGFIKLKSNNEIVNEEAKETKRLSKFNGKRSLLFDNLENIVPIEEDEEEIVQSPKRSLINNSILEISQPINNSKLIKLNDQSNFTVPNKITMDINKNILSRMNNQSLESPNVSPVIFNKVSFTKHKGSETKVTSLNETNDIGIISSNLEKNKIFKSRQKDYNSSSKEEQSSKIEFEGFENKTKRNLEAIEKIEDNERFDVSKEIYNNCLKYYTNTYEDGEDYIIDNNLNVESKIFNLDTNNCPIFLRNHIVLIGIQDSLLRIIKLINDTYLTVSVCLLVPPEDSHNAKITKLLRIFKNLVVYIGDPQNPYHLLYLNLNEASKKFISEYENEP